MRFFSPLKAIAAVVTLTSVLTGGSPAYAGMLNPLDFTSLGALNLGSGISVISVNINTNGPTPTMTFGSTTYDGVLYNEGTASAPHNVAVFDFSSINLSSASISGNGANPFAILSQTDFSLTGVAIDVSGSGGRWIGGNGISGSGGPGGGNGSTGMSPGNGPGGGGFSNGSGGGGGFGGVGGAGDAGGLGGASYGDLHTFLQGGSGGGGANDGILPPGPGGGGGGGAVELGAVGNLTFSNASGNVIYANGGNGGGGVALGNYTGGGGGSGGGIFLHGDSVTLAGAFYATGDPGGGAATSPGGGGGGGRILIQYGSGGFTNSGTLDVAGGAGGDNNVGSSPGAAGTIDIEQLSPSSAVPEPSSLTLLGLGALGLLGYARRRRASASA